MGKMSQTDWIVFGVAAFLGVVAIVLSIVLARTPVAPAPAPTVASGFAKLPDVPAKMETALPGGSKSNNGATSGAFGRGGPGGPPGGFGGPGGPPAGFGGPGGPPPGVPGASNGPMAMGNNAGG